MLKANVPKMPRNLQ